MNGAESGLQGSQPLGSRYRLLRELGRGGFGHTYLAEDLSRYSELCVLKEFVPQVDDPALLVKAKELFEREAGVLYQLQHPQIPQFRELLKIESEDLQQLDDTGDRARLFLVQDYVEGPTYQALLAGRLGAGSHFSELEVTQLLHQLLPVLDYIHGVGVIHRDISPDNLILRSTDGLPVLIDFGGVKQVAATVHQQLDTDGPQDVTRIGKAGFVPPEQFQTGAASPSSDLYALAVTVLVLASGEEPEALYDPAQNRWHWVPPFRQPLQSVLERMLAPRPADRFPTAAAALAALSSQSAAAVMAGLGAPQGSPYNGAEPDPDADPDAEGHTAATVVAAPADPDAEGTLAAATAQPPIEAMRRVDPLSEDSPTSGCWQAAVGLLVLLGLAGLLGLFFVARPGWLRLPERAPQAEVEPEPDTESGGTYSAEEAARKQALADRRRDLEVSETYLNQLTNQLFYQRYPDLTNRPLTDRPEDAPLRLRWDNLASDLLDILASQLSTQARRGLGSYGPGDRDRWQTQITPLNVSSRALYDLADAKFARLFPSQTGEAALSQPVGQVWYGLADDRVRSLSSGERLQTIQFEPNAFSQQNTGQLAPGEGQVYTLNLTADQILRLNLQAPASSTLLSLYLPRPNQDLPYLLSDASETRWSGPLPQTGFYEVVVVSRASQPISYQLTTIVDRVTSTPEEPSGSEPPASDDAPPPEAEPETPAPDSGPDDGAGNGEANGEASGIQF